MGDDDNEFQKYVEATAKYGRTPTGLKVDYSHANFINCMESCINQLTEQIRTKGRSRSTSQRSKGQAMAPTDLTEYSANSDEIRNIFALSAKHYDSKDQLDHSEQIRRWELEAQKLIARAPSRKRDKLQKVHDNWVQS
jgi:hypothetical protein